MYKKGIILFILILLLLVTWRFGSFYTKKISKEAFVNSSLTRVSADIRGELHLNDSIEIGSFVKKGVKIGYIEAKNSNQDLTNMKSDVIQMRQNLSIENVRLESLHNRIDYLNTEKNETNKLLNKQKELDSSAGESSAVLKKLELKNSENHLKEVQLKKSQALSLVEIGGLHEKALDQIDLELQEAEIAILKNKEAIKQNNRELDNLKFGLQAGEVRGFSEAYSKLKNIESEIHETTLEIKNIMTSIQQHQKTINEIESLTKDIEITNLYAKEDGFVWDIISKSGEILNNGESILSTINCNNIEVVGFIEESKVKNIKVGDPVRIEGLDIEIDGKISYIRRGTGRFNIGQSIVEPPSEVIRREFPVKIDTIGVDLNKKGGDFKKIREKYFCGVGTKVNIYTNQ